jgi:type IV secretory pathway VirB10-like protein
MKPDRAPALLLARRLGLGLMALACASGVWAQWQWKDASGRRIFSDTPPPASVPEKDILQRPRGSAPSPLAPTQSEPQATTSAPAAPSAKPGAASAPAGDAKLEERKQQLDKAEAEKHKAEQKAAEEAQAKARAINCDNARRTRSAVESGVRLSTTNAQGEREFLDEAARGKRLREAEASIRENCR